MSDQRGARRRPIGDCWPHNVPIVKFSVDCGTRCTSRPACVLARPALHADFLYPHLIMVVGFLYLFLALTLTRMQMEILRQKLRRRS